ncbi:hypothetical protein B0T16DRAFT_181152 [Cercophora newfieldiana]|uniref:Secreted protein n=1 Tax=Cercophora newfieldiana TaxID=92897 RepID=A0AA39XZW7_9PEZI|nr:hypothetical protein B0T16DRAFT_181152 [Cercophora newfieldiana]
MRPGFGLYVSTMCVILWQHGLQSVAVRRPGAFSSLLFVCNESLGMMGVGSTRTAHCYLVNTMYTPDRFDVGTGQPRLGMPKLSLLNNQIL